MAVRAHGDQIATALAYPLDNLRRRIAVGQLRLRRNVRGMQLRFDFGQISPVFVDLAADRIGAVRPRGPPIGYVQQRYFALAEPGQRDDVVKNRAIGGRRVERDQNVLVHDSPIVSLTLRVRAWHHAERDAYYPPTMICQALLRE